MKKTGEVVTPPAPRRDDRRSIKREVRRTSPDRDHRGRPWAPTTQSPGTWYRRSRGPDNHHPRSQPRRSHLRNERASPRRIGGFSCESRP